MGNNMKDNLIEYRKQIIELSEKDKKLRDLYLKRLVNGELQGPLTGYDSIDKRWLQYYDENDILTELPKMSIYEYLREKNKDNLSEKAIDYLGHTMTYKELFVKIDKVEKSLRNMGIKKGDVVTVFSVTTPELIFLFYALNKIGAVPNMIDPRNVKNVIEKCVKDTASSVVFVLDAVYPMLKESIDALDFEKTIIMPAVESAPIHIKGIAKLKNKSNINYNNNLIKWNDFIKGNCSPLSEDRKQNNLDLDNAAVIVYTSGSTSGVPKGVILTNDNLNAVVSEYPALKLEINQNQTILNIMPPFIAYGVTCGIHLPLCSGMKSVLIPKFKPQELPSLIKKHKPQNFMGVPAHFSAILDSPELEKENLEYLKNPSAGGAPLSKKLENEINHYLNIHNCNETIKKGYGMTELSSSAISSHRLANSIGSVGVPLIKNNVSIFEPDTDKELLNGEEGEICITGPSIMKGYVSNPEEQKKVKKSHSDGSIWVHTGDLGYINENGELFISGRIKNVIQRPDGHNNYLFAIENELLSNEAVDSCAVIALNVSEKFGSGEVPIAIISGDKLNDDKISEIKEQCSSNMPKRDVPCYYLIIKEFPYNDSGKINYVELSKMFNKMLEENPVILNEVCENYKNTLNMEKTLQK